MKGSMHHRGTEDTEKHTEEAEIQAGANYRPRPPALIALSFSSTSLLCVLCASVVNRLLSSLLRRLQDQDLLHRPHRPFLLGGRAAEHRLHQAAPLDVLHLGRQLPAGPPEVDLALRLQTQDGSAGV